VTEARRLARLCLLGWLLLAPGAGAAEPVAAAVRVDVALPPAAAWERMRDFSVAHRYVPDITRTEITTAAREGVGASRRVYGADGDYLEETVVAWRPGEGFAIRLHRGAEPMAPMKSAEFRYGMAPLDAQHTRVTLALLLEMPLGGVGAWLGEHLARPTMEEQLVQIAAGLRHYYETGEPATDADRARLASAVTVLDTAEAGAR
jgi:Polyketide cyclase / dehydrase and lipid transport